MQRLLRRMEGLPDENVPTKALLASALIFAAFSLFSSVSSARVSLKSSGEGTDEGGVVSSPVEKASEPLIEEEQSKVPVR